RPAARLVAGRRAAFLIAASPARLGPGRAPAVLLLARPLDQPLLAALTARVGGPILVTDGRRPLGEAGGPGGGVLSQFAGRARGAAGVGPPTLHAAGVEIGPGLRLWALGRPGRVDASMAAADRTRRRISWAVAAPLAGALAAWSLRRRRTVAAPPVGSV